MQASSVAARLLDANEPSRADRVHRALRAGIVDGDLPPGTHLNELVIASELGVSRTPVREALRRLEQEGLAVRPQGLGLQVVQLKRKDAAEIIGIRSVLEGYAARLAAERITAPELERVRKAHMDAARALEDENRELLLQSNTTFHDTIAAASHSPRCVAMISELQDWVLRYRAQVLSHEEERRRSFEQHACLLEALARGDGEETEGLMRAHILATTTPVLNEMDKE